MNKNLKMLFVTAIVALGLFLIYRIVFIRTVYYEIAGIKIPSQYNVLTGKAKPIINYQGKSALPTVETHKADKLGLSEGQVVIAQLRWAVFEEWANSHPEYKGWQEDASIFKKAHDDFRKEIEEKGPKIRVVK